MIESLSAKEFAAIYRGGLKREACVRTLAASRQNVSLFCAGSAGRRASARSPAVRLSNVGVRLCPAWINEHRMNRYKRMPVGMLCEVCVLNM